MTRTHIHGWAFTSREKEEQARRQERYGQLKHYRNQVVKNITPMYGMTKYSVRVPEGLALSPEDLAILCDDGNTCFGATVDFHGREGIVTIFTD